MTNENMNITNIISVIAIIISVLSGLAVAYFSAWIINRNDKTTRHKENVKQLIELFYSPILSMLSENNTLYYEFGPPKFLGKSPETAASLGEGWNSIKKTVIKPNLQSIRILIQKYWIQVGAKDKIYIQELLLHCTAFCEYDMAPNEMYEKYKYKRTWKNDLEKEIFDLEKELLS